MDASDARRVKGAVIVRYYEAGIALDGSMQAVRNGVRDTAGALMDGHILVLFAKRKECRQLVGLTSSLYDNEGRCLTHSKKPGSHQIDDKPGIYDWDDGEESGE